MNKNLNNLRERKKGYVRHVIGEAGVQKYFANNFRLPGVSYEQLVHLTGPIKNRQSPQARTNKSAARTNKSAARTNKSAARTNKSAARTNKSAARTNKSVTDNELLNNIRHQSKALNKLEDKLASLLKNLLKSQDARNAEALVKSRPRGPRVRQKLWY